MASDNKKSKAETAPKADTAPKTDTASKTDAPAKTETAPKNDAAAKAKSPAAEDVSKPAGGEPAAAAPSNYSRGEGQKPVTAAYKENWNAIFAKKKTNKKRR
jgi:hypothetical protein